MKTRIVSIVILVMLSMNLHSQSTVRLQGSIKHVDDKSDITLTRIADEDKVVASTQLKKNNFSLQFEAGASDFYLLSYGNDESLLIVLHPNAQVEISIDNQKVSFIGSYENQQRMLMLSEIEPLQAEYGELYFEYDLTEDSVSEKKLEARIDMIIEEYYKKVNDYLKANAGSMLCLILLEDMDINNDFEVFAIVNDSLTKKYPDNYFVQALNNQIEKYQKTAVGKMAPEISLNTPDNKNLKLSDLRGKIVLIDFWASWCGPCRRESPNMVKIYEKYKASDFEILGVSLDKDHNAWVNAIETDGLIWKHVSDLLAWETIVINEYGFDGIPYTVLVDKQGKIIAKGLRGNALEEKLHELFGY